VRVLHLIDNLHIGGACKLLLSNIKELNKLGVYNEVVYFGANEALLPEFKDEDIYIKRLKYSGLGDFIQVVVKLKRHIEVHSIDIIHANLTLDKRIGVFSSLLAKKDFVCTVHYANNPYKAWKKHPVRQLLYSFVDDLIIQLFVRNVVAVSNASKKAYQARQLFNLQSIEVIPNGVKKPEVDVAFIDLLVKYELQFDPLLIAVGRLHPIKGYPRLIRLLSDLLASYPKVGLIILGDGEMMKELKQLVNELGVANNVVFAGFQKQIGNYLAVSDIFINSSHSEAMPMTILEAMSLGKPVIASNVGGINEIIKDGENGFLVDYNDVMSTKEKIKFIIDNKIIRNQILVKAQESFNNKYSSIISARNIYNYYKMVVAM